jgi:poly(hydroxyalkanoate) depolymerase family esterase
MAGIRTSLDRLRNLRNLFEKRLGTAAGRAASTPFLPTRLQAIANFGSNPGNLRMYAYVPKEVRPSPPLVVALHGCTQTAASYDRGTGWSQLADALGFVVLFPEQQTANNPKNCFSWFLPGDTTRDSGEALSIRQMIAKAADEFDVDRSRIFVTGLSAGGAMTSVMLATYPEVFAGGAIIAGLPYGSAASVQEAFEAMFNECMPSSRALGDKVRGASTHRGPWPKISVWHGTADTIVRPSNGEHIIRQWLDVQKLPERPSCEDRTGRHSHRVWNDANGDRRVEAFSIAGMAHGVPLATTGAEACGVAGPFFLEAGISSTMLIARSWALDTAHDWKRSAKWRSADVIPAEARPYPVRIHDRAPAEPSLAPDRGFVHRGPSATDPAMVIESAFKAAGLPVPERTGRAIDPAAVISAALKAAGLTRRV